MKISEYLPLFQRYLQASTDLQPQSRTRYAYEVDRFGRELGDPDMAEITPGRLLEWHGRFHDQGASPSTVSQKKAALKWFFRYLEEFQEVPEATVLSQRLDRLRSPGGYQGRLSYALTGEEFQRLRRSLARNRGTGPRDAALGQLAWDTAARRGEIVGIRLLDLERELSPRRVQAVINCQASSRLLAEALSTPLLARPMAVPGMLPVAELPDFELPPTPTRRNVALLARHLQLLQQLGVQRRDVQGRLAELEQDLLDWEGQLEEAIATESAREEPRPAVLTGMRRVLTAVGDAGSSLGVRDVAGAIQALGRAFPVAPEPPEAPAGPPPEERELPPAPTISLPTRFSTRSVPRLVTHLQELAELAEEHEWPGEERPQDQWPEMEAEVARLLEAATGWRDAAQELLKEEQDKRSPSQAREEALGQRVEDLEEYVGALEAQDLTRAVEALEAIETME